MRVGVSVRKGVAAAALAVAVLGAGCANQQKLLGQDLAGMGAGGVGVARPGSAQDFQVNVGDRVFFDTDSSSLNGQAQMVLAKQAQWLNQYRQYSFIIEGHADERGTREYNLALGARRAEAARDFLTSRGIDPRRMRTVSYGKERPVAVCSDPSCWSQNRRAVTVLQGAGS
ncbi:peptidoglycan-associated lipoprotein Pal [Propylenella binzhouense]|uniref:Peptidoglycan-associated lipoprotein n=1 Tax=Propylenella binzhouense TaxID=2555902 RepID=A0A964WTM7_9HYPH|nr:peptidoglycan-associated lipoprotein Pal [Propylenella binzhouense]MYZ48141.1 peptidoglycan-associated lipoprotein Pal [Propylenella binzhouense]